MLGLEKILECRTVDAHKIRAVDAGDSKREVGERSEQCTADLYNKDGRGEKVGSREGGIRNG